MEESNPSQIAFTLSWKRVYVKSNLTQSIILLRLLRISTQARGKNVNDRKTGEAEAMKRCNKWRVKQRKEKRERGRSHLFGLSCSLDSKDIVSFCCCCCVSVFSGRWCVGVRERLTVAQKVRAWEGAWWTSTCWMSAVLRAWGHLLLSMASFPAMSHSAAVAAVLVWCWWHFMVGYGKLILVDLSSLFCCLVLFDLSLVWLLSPFPSLLLVVSFQRLLSIYPRT